MNKSEQRGKAFFAHRGYMDIEHQPDGQHCSPDFLLDRRIAVEVRRLNQNYEGKEGTEGLETEAVRSRNKIRKLALSLGPPTEGKSWFLTVKFRRPVPRWKGLEPSLRQVLRGFIDGSHAETRVSFGDRVVLELFPASVAHRTFYVPGPANDRDSGGWVLSELERNLRICINEKTLKLQSYKANYPEWWLVLDDHIDFSLDDIDREHFSRTVSLPSHQWDKIILISPLSPRRAFQIAPECRSL
jgi:hypothetical protein